MGLSVSKIGGIITDGAKGAKKAFGKSFSELKQAKIKGKIGDVFTTTRSKGIKAGLKQFGSYIKKGLDILMQPFKKITEKLKGLKDLASQDANWDDFDCFEAEI